MARVARPPCLEAQRVGLALEQQRADGHRLQARCTWHATAFRKVDGERPVRAARREIPECAVEVPARRGVAAKCIAKFVVHSAGSRSAPRSSSHARCSTSSDAPAVSVPKPGQGAASPYPATPSPSRNSRMTLWRSANTPCAVRSGRAKRSVTALARAERRITTPGPARAAARTPLRDAQREPPAVQRQPALVAHAHHEL